VAGEVERSAAILVGGLVDLRPNFQEPLHAVNVLALHRVDEVVIFLLLNPPVHLHPSVALGLARRGPHSNGTARLKWCSYHCAPKMCDGRARDGRKGRERCAMAALGMAEQGALARSTSCLAVTKAACWSVGVERATSQSHNGFATDTIRPAGDPRYKEGSVTPLGRVWGHFT
jgi:hypothetical protein